MRNVVAREAQPQPSAAGRAIGEEDGGERYERRVLTLLGLIVAIAAAARFISLGDQGFDLDEMVTSWIVHLDFGHMLSTVSRTESTPPLYYALAWIWVRLFGSSEFALRSLSACAGTALVPVTYLAARELLSRRGALIASLLVAVSPWLVLHSQEARSYALLTLLAGLSFLFFARSLRAPSGAQIGWWAVTSGLALATHYFAIFLVAPEAVWLLVASRRRGPVLLGVAAVTAVGAALLPLALHQRSEGNPDAALVHGGSLALRIIEVPKQSLVGFDGPAEIVTAVAAAALCAVSLFFLATGSSPADRQRLAPAAGIGLAAVAAPLLVAFVGLDYLVARNLIVAWVPFAVVVAAGLSATRLRTVGLVVTAALTALFATVVIAVAVDPSYQRADWRGAAASLGAPQTSRAIVVQPPTAANTYRIYLPGVHALPRHGARVSEIDLITVASYLSAPGRARRAPNPKALPAPFPGFREVGRRHEQTYTVVRYGSPAPRLVMPTALAQRGLKSHRRSSVLYQGAVPTIATP